MRPRDLNESLGKLPPQSLDMEESVLGAVLIQKNAIIDIAGFLRAEHFYLDHHQAVYTAIMELFAASDPIDMRTVVSRLRKNGKMELVGGASAIAELTSKVSSAANIEYHAHIIVEMAMKRSMIQLGSMIHHDSYDDTKDVFDVIEKSNAELQSILDNALNASTEKAIKDIAFSVVQEQASRQSGIHTGLDSGFEVVDQMLNGFNKTDLIVIAARPGMGKSAFVSQAAKNIASRKIPVGIFSLEMSAMQIVERLATGATEIMADSVKKGILNDSDLIRFNYACGDLGQLPLYIDDTAFLSIIELRARAMRMKSKYGIQLLIVDYLQLIKGVGESGKTSNNRDQEIGIITRTLKGIAKELEIPVIALSQLNRSVETRGGAKRPMLSDLRESGCLLGSTKVYCPRLAKNVRIEDLVHRNNLYILALHNDKMKAMKAKKCWKTGRKEVFQITLINGQAISATANHKFLSIEGWKPVSQFKNGESLAVPISYSAVKKDKIKLEEIRVVGHMLSNGSCLKGQPIRYACNVLDQDLSDVVMADAIAATGNKVAPRKEDSDFKGRKWTTIYFKPTFHLTHGKTSPIADIMRKYNLFDVRSAQKFIPDQFFFLSHLGTCEFLKALFSGDGCAYYREVGNRKQLKFTYSSASEELIFGVQSLLAKVGVLSTVRQVTNKKNQTWHSLAVDGRSNIEMFINHVGFIQERKQKIMRNGWLSVKGTLAGWTKSVFNDQRTLAFIPIKSIESIGQHDVYDIEVPKAHSFMADGILAHNSIEQDADIVILLYRPEYYKITTDENGFPTHGKCEVIVEKHRGGSTGTVIMKFIGKYTKFVAWEAYNKKPDYVRSQKDVLPPERDFDPNNPF